MIHLYRGGSARVDALSVISDIRLLSSVPVIAGVSFSLSSTLTRNFAVSSQALVSLIAHTSRRLKGARLSPYKGFGLRHLCLRKFP